MNSKMSKDDSKVVFCIICKNDNIQKIKSLSSCKCTVCLISFSLYIFYIVNRIITMVACTTIIIEQVPASVWYDATVF